MAATAAAAATMVLTVFMVLLYSGGASSGGSKPFVRRMTRLAAHVPTITAAAPAIAANAITRPRTPASVD